MIIEVIYAQSVAILKIPGLNYEELFKIENQIEETRKKKNESINNQKFEEAADLRDEERELQKIKDMIEKTTIIIDDKKLKEIDEKISEFVTPEHSEIDDFLSDDKKENIKLSKKKIEIVETVENKNDKKREIKNDDFIDLRCQFQKRHGRSNPFA